MNNNNEEEQRCVECNMVDTNGHDVICSQHPDFIIEATRPSEEDTMGNGNAIRFIEQPVGDNPDFKVIPSRPKWGDCLGEQDFYEKTKAWEAKQAEALDVQVGGNHYKDMAIQPVEFCQKNKLGFCESSVIKYITRHNAKNGAEDIRKAIHFCQLLLSIQYGERDEEPTPTIPKTPGPISENIERGFDK